MKLGILTFVHTSNYGAVLQAYAMQTLLDGLGAENEFVDYYSPAVMKNHDPKMLWRRRGMANKLALPMMYYVYKKRLKRFSSFEDKYLRFSRERYDRSNITESGDRFERFLVGSDQVWNTSLTDGDMSFFLDFVSEKNRKLSYAASMGASDIPIGHRGKCHELIRGFSAVNVRERTSAQVLGAAGIDARCVLDPTLMLRADQWMPFVSARPHKKKYIFMYMPPSDGASLCRIREHAKKLGCDIFQVKKGIKPTRGVKTLNTLSPEEFLTWLYHAELVISGSFHGVCFSVLFEKPFWAFSARTESLTGRIDDLLSELDLGERKYSADPGFSAKPVDYSSAIARLDRLREASAEILSQTLQIR